MKHARRKWIALIGVGAAIMLVGAAWAAYLHDLRMIRDRVSAASQVLPTRHGLIEFATWGSGPAVLVAHGAGGGYDHARLVAKAYGGAGLRWIAPSRFGYLRSSLPADASTAAQADAFAALLDALKIERVAILAMSGGVPPSLQFAERHPARTSALVLLSSAPYTPLKAQAQQLPVPAWVYEVLFSSDLPYWALQKIARAKLETIFDVTPAAQAAATAEESAFVADMVDAFQPVSRRVDGVRNEGAAVDPRARYALGKISAPTLVIHARDDGINPFAFGEYTAQHIAGAEFMPLASGGHLLLGHLPAVRAKVNSFLRRHAAGAQQ
jgi:pimeloyl-ACP methyl ester carboxylesterase